jgi:hypothetical protein
MSFIVVILLSHVPVVFSAGIDLPAGPQRSITGKSSTGLSLSFEVKDEPTIQAVGEQHRLTLLGFHQGGNVGEPELPRYTFTFLLPAPTSAEKAIVTLENATWEDLPSTYAIIPVAPPAISSSSSAAAAQGKGNAAIYSSDAWFPSNQVVAVETSQYRSYALLRVTLTPASYNPVQKTLRILRSGSLRVEYPSVDASAASTQQTTSEPARFTDSLLEQLENPEDLARPQSSQDQGGATSASSYYIIVTTDSIVSASGSTLTSFKTHKESKGFNVRIITEASSEDDNHYATGSTADQRANNIRSWLKSRYSSLSIEYVLLIGYPNPTSLTSDSVPMKITHPDDSLYQGQVYTDMFYAELSGNWDLNNNGDYGEYSGDYGTGGMDRDCEVNVGRIPYYSSSTDLNSILTKTMNYENASGDQDWRKKILIPSSISNHGPQDNNNDGVADVPLVYRTFGADWGNAVKTMAQNNSYSTYTLFEKSGVYSDGSAYPTDSCDASLSSTNVLSAWQQHYGFVTWWGHGSSYGAYRRTWDDDNTRADNITQHSQETTDTSFFYYTSTSSLDDSYPSFVFQVSCTNGDPTSSVNLGFSLLKRGAIATVSASVVSWYNMGSWSTSNAANGMNTSYGYVMPKRMIEQSVSVGKAFTYIKSYFSSVSSYVIWNMHCFNIYGDPAVSHAVSSGTPPTVTTTSASAIMAATATSGGNVTSEGDASVTARGVCWSTSSSPTTSNSKTTDGSGSGAFTSSITGLSPITTYYVRAYATSSAGTSYGSQVSFTTLASTVKPTVTTTEATSITSSTATSGGNVTDAGSYSVTARGVCWNTSGSPTTSDSKTSDGSGTGSFTSSVTGLSASTTYYLRAYATNSAGVAYGDQITIETPAVGAPTVTTTTPSAVKTSTATGGGNVTNNGNSSVTARGVCWNTTGTPTTSDSKTTDGTGTGAFTSSITGLTANTHYYVRAYATNTQGTAYGDAVSFTTARTSSGKFIIWQNTSTGEIRWWSLSTSGAIVSEEDGVGHGKVSASTLDGNWRFTGAATIGGYATLFFQNTSTGYVSFWQLDETATMVNSGTVSDTITVNSNWRAVGVTTVDSVPTILWQNQSSGKVVFWKIGSDGKLTSEVKDTGWGFVSDTLTVNSAWRLAGVTEIGGVKILIWQNQSTGKVVWWRLTSAIKLYNETKDSGWGFVSDTLALSSSWNLAGIASGQRLLWQNQSTGKIAWWALNSSYKLTSTSKDVGWGYVSDNLTISSSWILGGITTLNSEQTLIWGNGSSGRAAYWKLNSSTQLKDDTLNSGWGFVSSSLTMKSSNYWRMCGLTE